MIEIQRRNTLPVQHEYSKAESLRDTADNILQVVDVARVVDLVDTAARSGWHPMNADGPCCDIVHVLSEGTGRGRLADAYAVLEAAVRLVIAREAAHSLDRLRDYMAQHPDIAEMLRSEVTA